MSFFLARYFGLYLVNEADHTRYLMDCEAFCRKVVKILLQLVMGHFYRGVEDDVGGDD